MMSRSGAALHPDRSLSSRLVVLSSRRSAMRTTRITIPVESQGLI